MPELWPFLAEANVNESYSFLTDILRGKGEEDRIRLRTVPRHFITIGSAITELEAARAHYLMRTNGRGEWYVPLFYEAQYIGSVSSAASSVSVTTANGDFRAGGYAMVWSDSDNCEVVSISSVTASAINISPSLVSSYTDAWCMPVLLGQMEGTGSIGRSEFGLLNSVISFMATSNADIASDPFGTYNSYPLVTDRWYRQGDFSNIVYVTAGVVDSPLGSRVYVTNFDDQDHEFPIASSDRLGADAFRRKKWLHSLYGRQKAFYCPTWQNELQLSSTIASGATSVTVATGIRQAAALNGKHVRLLLNDGTAFNRQISSVSIGVSTTTFNISSSLGQEVTPSDVDNFSLLPLVRLAYDDINISYRKNYADFASSVTEVAA